MSNHPQKKEISTIKPVAFLSVGTLLEYFDLMLYIHMASLLNSVFFAPADSQSEALLATFSYSMTYIFRPIGAVLFGYIGDKYGRMLVIFITMFLISLSCLTIFFLPPYEQIGVAASIILTICRVVQGISTMGEMVGAEIYITEMLKGKARYIAVGFLSLMPSLGTILALGVAKFVTKDILDWRYAFLLGFFIVAVGGFLRIQQRSVKDYFPKRVKEKVSIKTYLTLLCLNLIHPAAFFIVFMSLSDVLKTNFDFNHSDIIDNSFIVSNSVALVLIINIFLLNYIKPLVISRVRITIFTLLIICLPCALNHVTSAWQITLLQFMLFSFGKDDLNCLSIQHSVVPKGARFKVGGTVIALSRVAICVVTTYGIVLTKPYLNNYVFTVFALPLCLAYHLALSHLKKLDRQDEYCSEKYYAQ